MLARVRVTCHKLSRSVYKLVDVSTGTKESVRSARVAVLLLRPQPVLLETRPECLQAHELIAGKTDPACLNLPRAWTEAEHMLARNYNRCSQRACAECLAERCDAERLNQKGATALDDLPSTQSDRT